MEAGELAGGKGRGEWDRHDVVRLVCPLQFSEKSVCFVLIEGKKDVGGLWAGGGSLGTGNLVMGFSGDGWTVPGP